MYHYIFSITTILFLSFTTLGYTQKSLGKTYKSTETFNLNGKVKYMTVSSYNLSKDGKNTPILAAKEDYYFNEEGNVVKEKFYRNEELIFEQNFSFDKKVIFNLFEDYPHNLTDEQKELFDKENPYWADFFKNRPRHKE